MPIIDLTPDHSLQEDIGAGSFTVEEAIAELVANSFDERVGDEPVRVDVQVSSDVIWVIDNCRGMELEELGEMVVLGYKNLERKKQGKPRKGMYGLGMKTACAAMGKLWGVYTKTVGSEKTSSFQMDLEEWSKRAGKRGEKWEGETFSSATFEGSPLNDRDRGTAIYVRKLRQKDASISAISERLSQAYKPHLDTGDEIFVNGEKLVSHRIDVAPESKTSIDDMVGPQKKWRIHGWVGVGKTNMGGAFGVNIYRQGQLVEAWNQDWFRAHTMTSRIRGDIHLDFVPSNFHKKGLDKTSAEWRVASEFMKMTLAPITKLSRDLSKNKNDVTREERAYKAFSQSLTTMPQLRRESSGAQKNLANVNSSKSKSQPKVSNDRAEIFEDHLVADGVRIALVHKLHGLGSKTKHWDYIWDEKKSELLIVLNSDSPLYSRVNDDEFLGVMAKADLIASFLIEKKGWKASEARDLRDVWLSMRFETGEA